MEEFRFLEGDYFLLASLIGRSVGWPNQLVRLRALDKLKAVCSGVAQSTLAGFQSRTKDAALPAAPRDSENLPPETSPREKPTRPIHSDQFENSSNIPQETDFHFIHR